MKKLSRKNKGRGAALVVTLALVVMITTLLLAFFINSTLNQQLEVSSTSRVETDILTRGALELIVGDLKQEMLAGSLPGAVADGVLRPSTNFTIMPSRVLSSGVLATDTNFSALVKQSVSATPFFTNSSPYNNNSAKANIVAPSGVSTTASAKNNRKISINRWNLPALNKGDGFTKASQVPNWIYLGTQGLSNATGTNVVGRFAYNVYNIGGALNVNVAGYPTSLSGASAIAITNRLSIKGTPIGATLQGNSFDLNVDSLIAWRNKVSFASGSLINYTNAILSNTNGFHELASGDNRFVSRQDLIRYANLHPGIVSTNALPYLTTFSLETNSPSWGPMIDAVNSPRYGMAPPDAPGAGFAYATKALDPSSTNRSFPSVRRVVGGDIVPYSTNGVALPAYKAEAGDPLVKKRFPLDRLKWITATGVSTNSSSAAVLSLFGLTWEKPSGSSGYWDYFQKSGTGTNAVPKIATLEEVANTSREPNFFELLKAAILDGSVAKNGGTAVSSNVQYDNKPDYQIFQIGCNIIDQYRSDDLPTTVLYDPKTLISGVVDLPYLNKLLTLFYRPFVGSPVFQGGAPVFNVKTPLLQDPRRLWIGAWLVPEYWRLHNRSIFSEANPLDQLIRLRSRDGDIYNFGTTAKNSAGSLNFTIGGSWIETPITFNGSNSFRDYPRVPAVGSGSDYSSIDDTLSGGGFKAMGINIGFTDRTHVPSSITEAEERDKYAFGVGGILRVNSLYGFRGANNMPMGGTDARFYLEVKDPSPGGEWIVFDTIKNLNGGLGSWFGQRQDEDPAMESYATTVFLPSAFRYSDRSNIFESESSLQIAMPHHAIMRADPRSDRFGFASVLGVQLGLNRASKYSTKANPKVYDPESAPRQVQSTSWRDNYNVNAAEGYGGMLSRGQNVPLIGQNAVGWGHALYPPQFAGYGGNYPAALADNRPDGSDGNLYYQDRDGIQRRAAGAYARYLFDDATRKPVMLNRRFFSVGDLGYAHRGEPWKNIDFFTPESADAGLLDVFSTTDQGEIVEGKIDLNSASVEVLAAYLQNTVKDETSSTPSEQLLDQSTALNIATKLKAEIDSAPFINKSDLVSRIGDTSPLRTALGTDKARFEILARGLADVVQTRTWNLLIDIIAQKGRVPAGKTDDVFIVEGERRYWLQIAIDRFTGEIIGQQLEAVNE